ncbi:alpha/beta hydrolase [Agaribacter flavus]|uniref:Alpha/beta hydrolase n=1 Tax=Agaribacter flavus TaxID=1902781 RepID=A0ABV7FNY1_9ALTE
MKTSLNFALILLTILLSTTAVADTGISDDDITAFSAIYEEELGELIVCTGYGFALVSDEIRVCSKKLKNEGNAPFIAPVKQAKGILVLYHGLSDSPFFMRSIAEHANSLGYSVIVPLTPGHGKLEADADMQDPNLQARWYEHVDQVMALAKNDNLPLFIGGFSTGGAFATWYTVQHPDEIDGLVLFSGALQLTGGAESMSKIWGMKTLAKWLDGTYETQGPNPYKYPSVASYSGLVLMDVIKDIRNYLKENTVQQSIFAAHSLADRVTKFEGIEKTAASIKGEHTIFKVDESYDLCHADLVINPIQIVQMEFDKAQVNVNERCAVPKANPLHAQMLDTFAHYLATQTELAKK